MTFSKALLLISLLLLCGCSSLSAPPTAATSPTQQANTNLSTPSTAATSPAQQANTGDNGIITGILVDEAGQPITDLGVFVADLSDGPNPEGKIISFQLGSSKQGLTDKQGKFTIEDVKAGAYSLAIWTPNTSMLIPEPDDSEGSAIQVEIKPGEVTNVGTLKIKRPT
jgi:hypothetical protein